MTTKAQREARGQDCTVQFPDICNHNPETVCGHHLRGTQKGRDDRFLVWCCSECHATIHRTINTDLDPEFVRKHELEGLVLTMARRKT